MAKHVAQCKAEFITVVGNLDPDILADALENELTRFGINGDQEITFWQNLTAVAHAGEVVNRRDDHLKTKMARRIEQAKQREAYAK